MSSIKPVNMLAFYATALITNGRGRAVKMGADGKHVSICTAATDKSIGIMQNGWGANNLNASVNAEDVVEVAMSGGGAKGLLGTGGCAAGDPLTSAADGSLIVATTTRQRIIGFALDAGVAGDFVPVEVQLGLW